jgi:hypothetical protein
VKLEMTGSPSLLNHLLNSFRTADREFEEHALDAFSLLDDDVHSVEEQASSFGCHSRTVEEMDCIALALRNEAAR